MIKLIQGDCLEVMATLEENSVDTIITDPPYALTANKKGGTGEASLNLDSPAGRSRVTTGGGFMGKEWDGAIPGIPFWTAALRVAKPGATLMAFGGTRTHHRLMCAIEDAGWELRDVMMYVYGSGFPKSHDISKAIDKAAGAERTESKWVDRFHDGGTRSDTWRNEEGRFPQGTKGNHITTPATDAAQLWDGWGTALKPAAEFWWLAYKPRDGTFAENALKWGVAGLNIDGGRVPGQAGDGWWGQHHRLNSKSTFGASTPDESWSPNHKGRWPANFITDGSDEVTVLFPETGKSNMRPPTGKPKYTGSDQDSNAMKRSSTLDTTLRGHNDNGGSAARFFKVCQADRLFYSAKASKSERNLGLDGTRTIKYNIPKSIGGILCKDVSMALVESLRKAMSELTVQWLIGESGASIMGLCPEDFLSITLTEISKITESRILHLLMQQLTNESTVDANCETVCGGSLVASAEDLSQSIKNSGTCQEKDTRFTEDVKCVISELLLKIRDEGNWQERTNIHSTVKPLSLMKYLAKLTRTPTGGVVLDPFMGSGTTGMAAVYEGRDFIGIELEPEYFEIATARIQHAIDEADKSRQIEMILP